MLFRTHIVFSLAVWLLLSYYVVMPFYVLIFVMFSTAFVDVDIRNSKAGNHWYLRPLQFFTRHRGIMHSLAVGLLLSLIIGSLNLWAGFGFFVGYVSHLFLDCLTKSGVRLFWPFGFKIKGFVKSGSVIEDIIFVFLLVGDVFFFGKVISVSLF